MRTEAANLRTWWLAGCALWALALWVASLAGLGSRLAPPPGAQVTAPALPALPPLQPEPLQGHADYSDIVARPLFADDRRPHPFFLGSAGQDNAGGLRLSGVLMVPGLEMATLTTGQGQSIRLRLGAAPVAGWQLLALQPRSATLSGPGGTQTLELQVFDGQGGQAPTELHGGPSAAVPAAAPSHDSGAATPPGVAVPPASGVAPAAPAGGQAAETPSPAQLQTIRERIQVRRRQLQQTPNGSPPGQNP
ncbi:hypothetical protein [Stenotrophomonas sp. YIM B06876]|uniref:hypothetical protein n=1 Tax=Stenotrophomonas sp. YIM B06876 TaxID=3060211 RepID=UPI00273961DE|nr:hypothetical protein [Stenotrophomonas sp. YIM B06876]